MPQDAKALRCSGDGRTGLVGPPRGEIGQMKVLLTGGCGFIGSAVIRHLIRHTGHVVVNVDKMTYAASEEALEEARHHQRPLLIRADIADAAAMRQVFETHDPDVVMHLAAESHVDRS